MAEIGIGVAIVCAASRGILVIVGIGLMLANRDRKIFWGRSMVVAFPEPFLLVLLAGWLWAFGSIAPMQGHALPLIVAGTLSSLVGASLFVWSLIANRGVGTGHYVDEDQVLVDFGPYGIMRHPIYSAAIFVWLGLALTHVDWAVLTFVYAYVMPAYYFYARDEERMMVRSFGQEYVEYVSRVPMLFPRWLTIWE